jgi:FKBP-type peptidyl-prolyl cis-trans isomerase FklB
MKSRQIAAMALFIGALSLLSCVDSDQTQEVILQRDKEAIEKFLKEKRKPMSKAASNKLNYAKYVPYISFFIGD